MTKDAIRREIRTKLASFSDMGEKSSRGFKLASEILRLVATYPIGSYIASYVSVRNELPTDSLISKLTEAGYKVVLPTWSVADSLYRFACFTGVDDLVPGPMRIMEPRNPEWVPTSDISLFVVPGLAFSRDGHRLGHGGGWYDRLLAARSPRSRLVGVGYDFQILQESIPLEPHDVVIDDVVGV